MTQWWTYRPSDFLMFSPRTYWRLVELYNQEIWPAQLVAAGVGLVLLGLTGMARPAAGRIACALLAAGWLWVGWAFHWQRYATINWAAAYLAVAFGLQAVLLATLGVLAGNGRVPPAAGARYLGWAMAVGGLLLYPLTAATSGRPWSQAEAFGVMPDPTALATLGLLLAGGRSHRGWLCIVPALSLLAGMATLWLLRG